ncbi:5-(carboxyamino)imidazole ribonucleotide mutase [Methanocella sp. CWC-04]|uniref:5-(Carboxyamino)imidazole ribonucleotide mutase n=1 Tax=Methanooceanicella nereidis TaxID=2052831 RepID=A0AAP2RGI8_9EURY|nr:AIR carboxylase family protein [Methanocella sp. CWC-04]MCD1296210.1 5-(carboxyamino)imidazole ribonucleotide mutase [Methanocella sp. CWC-04]
MVDIAVILGSLSDQHIADKVTDVLTKNNVSYDLRILSAHRDPDALDAYVRSTDARIFITIAGLSAALPGVVAARTDKPVIGVPVSAKLGGLDALLSIAQMPKGVPVACVGIDNGDNAAHMAIRILKLIK